MEIGNIKTDNLFRDRGLWIESTSKTNFESHYINLRAVEDRLADISAIRDLPRISENHPDYKIWKIRSHSSKRIIEHLSRKHKSLTILDIGCGNGWFSHLLTGLPNAQVIGLDIQKTELLNAVDAFGEKQGLSFVCADIFNDIFKEKSFDVIVMGASIAYFKSIPQLFDRLFELLTSGGEIHIFDSPFYSFTEIDVARKRSRDHFDNKGTPDMIDYYFHHLWDDLKEYDPEYLYQPHALINRVMRKLGFNLSPFPWIKISP